jgi:hypothetical protein
MGFKKNAAKGFCENVRRIVRAWDVGDVEVTIVEVRPDEVIPDIDVFGARVIGVIGGERDRTLVVGLNG